MKLLTASGRPHRVALFGSGLIGSAIEERLRQYEAWTVQVRPYSWNEDERRRAELTALMDELAASPSGSALGRPRRSIVWAAGVSGFGASEEQMSQEVGMIAELCEAANALASGHPTLDLGFHLISSGGGLFEGKTQINRRTEPLPLRPYGRGKLRQEHIVRAMEPGISKQIYRPSSVYGFKPSARLGLFATLIMNALANKPTLISGKERTIRDYIFVRDIGDFVARKLLETRGGDAIHILASGKPTTMFEVIASIERLVRRPLYRRFESKPSNARDISFAQSGLPADLIPTPLYVGLAWLDTKIRDHMTRHPEFDQPR